jgi:glycosyltransferase involved in cell wall biosynthesis
MSEIDLNSKAYEQDPISTPKLSVVLPVFEEAENVKLLIPSLIQFLQGRELSFEVIVVDDGSQDESAAVLQSLVNDFPAILRVVQHLANRGNGAALRTGIRIARGEIVVTMDADGQHVPEDLPQLISKIPPYDLVIGARMINYEGSWYRGAANSFYNKFASWLTRSEILDLTSGYRAMRRSIAVHFLPLFPNGFSAPTTTTMAFLKAGYNVAFESIHVRQREQGKSKIRLWEDGIRFIMVILRMIMLYDPLRIFLPTGMFLALLGVLAWIAGLLNAGRLVLPNSTVFLLSAAVMIWLLGLISDQVANTRVHYYGDESIVLLKETEKSPQVTEENE